MFRDRSVHLQAFLAEGFIDLGILLNPKVDPYYFASSAGNQNLVTVDLSLKIIPEDGVGIFMFIPNSRLARTKTGWYQAHTVADGNTVFDAPSIF